MRNLIFLVLLASACAGQVEEPETETSPIESAAPVETGPPSPMVCEVPFTRVDKYDGVEKTILCEFVCTDCRDADDCVNALGTAIDECLFQLTHPQE